jgi:transposase
LADMEIYAWVERRRRWTAQEKAALLAEIDAEGGRVRLVARRHRIAESLLYNWRAARKAASAMMPTPMETTFLPLGLLGGPRPYEPASLARTNSDTAGGIEIVLPSGARVSVDTSVNEQALSRVLRAMRSVT